MRRGTRCACAPPAYRHPTGPNIPRATSLPPEHLPARAPQLLALLLGDKVPADVALTSELLHQLLRCCGESHNAASSSSAAQIKELWQPAAELALQCLGELGAVDPTRVGAPPPPRNSARTRSGSERSFCVDDDELCVRLLEGYLVKTLRGAYEGQVPPAAYACTVLLQDICHCNPETPFQLSAYQDFRERGGHRGDGSDAFQRLGIRAEHARAVRVWGLLQESTRHTMKPFLQLRAVLPPSGTAGPEPSPIFRRGVRYSDWLARWCRHDGDTA